MKLSHQSRKDYLVKTFFAIISLSVLVILMGIFIFLFVVGAGFFKEVPLQDFFLSSNWNPEGYSGSHWGMLGLLVSTIMITLGALVIAVPIGIGCAIYLSEIASSRVREILKPIIEMIAGIPSVVLGLIGLLFLSPLIAKIFHLSSGLNALTASIVVAIMVLPTIISITEDVLRNLPNEFREASLALGATKWQMIKMTLLPAALPGIFAAVMLGLGRAVGETMAVLIVAGNSLAMPLSFFDPARTITADIAIEIKEVVIGSLHYEALFVLGLVLFLLTFAINFISDIILENHARKYRW